MANEITLSVNFLAAKNGASVSAVLSKSITMPDGSDDMNSQSFTVGMTSATMPVGIVGDGGITAVKNFGPGLVYIGRVNPTTSGDATMIVGVGEVAIFRRPSSILYMLASAASTLTQVVTVEI